MVRERADQSVDPRVAIAQGVVRDLEERNLEYRPPRGIIPALGEGVGFIGASIVDSARGIGRKAQRNIFVTVGPQEKAVQVRRKAWPLSQLGKTRYIVDTGVGEGVVRHASLFGSLEYTQRISGVDVFESHFTSVPSEELPEPKLVRWADEVKFKKPVIGWQVTQDGDAIEDGIREGYLEEVPVRDRRALVQNEVRPTEKHEQLMRERMKEAFNLVITNPRKLAEVAMGNLPAEFLEMRRKLQGDLGETTTHITDNMQRMGIEDFRMYLQELQSKRSRIGSELQLLEGGPKRETAPRRCELQQSYNAIQGEFEVISRHQRVTEKLGELGQTTEGYIADRLEWIAERVPQIKRELNHEGATLEQSHTDDLETAIREGVIFYALGRSTFTRVSPQTTLTGEWDFPDELGAEIIRARREALRIGIDAEANAKRITTLGNAVSSIPAVQVLAQAAVGKLSGAQISEERITSIVDATVRKLTSGSRVSDSGDTGLSHDEAMRKHDEVMRGHDASFPKEDII